MALPRRHAGRVGHLTTRFPIQPERAALAATLREVQEWTGQRPEREKLGRSIMDALGGEPYDQSRLRRNGGKELVIAEAEGAELPPGLAFLPQVEKLRFDETAPRTKLDSRNLPPNLKVLDFSRTDLKELPDVRGLGELRDLHLDFTKIQKIPAWIADLPPRLNVHLEGAPLSPAAVEMLKELSTGPGQISALYYNGDRKVQEIIRPHEARLIRAWDAWKDSGTAGEERAYAVSILKNALSDRSGSCSLALKKTLVFELPPCLDLVPLDEVALPSSLRDKRIDLGKVLPQSVCRLDLSWCGLNDLRLQGLNLHTLNASGNKFQEPPDLSSLKSVVDLDLSMARMPFAPRMDHMKALQNVNLAYNEIAVFPDLSGCPSLAQINLRMNRLETVPTWIASLSDETEVLLQENPLNEASLDFLRSLERPSIRF